MDDAFKDYEMEESDTSESQDRLSELPLSLKFHIFSFLTMKDVVSTTILSKCWKNLWNTVPYLNFCDAIKDDNDAERIRNFVNQTLIFWKGNKILRFRIDFKGHFDMSLAKDVDVWVCFAKENNVEELYMHLSYDPRALDSDNAGRKEGIYRVPQCLNSCSSIKTLSIKGCNLLIPESPPWKQLKWLRIDGFCFSEHLINRVLSGTPKLEVFKLRFMESNENLNIWSTSLRKLVIEKYKWLDGPSPNTVLRIDCPNLGMLKISGLPYSKCVLTSVSSLTDATLRLNGVYYFVDDDLAGKDLLGEMTRQILSTIRCVEKVVLSDWCVQVLGESQKKDLLSPLSNVKFVKLDLSCIQLDELVHLLGIFPNVKKLVIGDRLHGYESKINLPESFLLQLRTIEVTSSLISAAIFPFLESLLKHSSLLEKMVIQADRVLFVPRKYVFQAAQKLLSTPRSSPTAEVIFKNLSPYLEELSDSTT